MSTKNNCPGITFPLMQCTKIGKYLLASFFFTIILISKCFSANNLISIANLLKDSSPIYKTHQEIIITDEKGQALENVLVWAANTKNKISFTSSANGKVSIQKNIFGDSSKLELMFAMVGYEKQHTIIYWKHTNEIARIILQPNINKLQDVVVASYPTCRCYSSRCLLSCINSKRKDSTTQIKLPLKNLANNTLTIYPNPASKGSCVHINLSETGSHTICLTDNNNRLIVKQSTTSINKNEVYKLPLISSLASGIYYITVINEETKNLQSQKLIVQ